MLTKEQLELRKQGIGGSEIAALAGLNPYATALDVWRAKVQGWTPEVTAPMERGTFLEDGVARWYAHRTGSTLREVGTMTHPGFVRVFCTPDRIASLSGERDLSIKVPGPYVREQWGEAGTDEVPMAALLQVQWELIVLEARLGIRVADIAAPIDGDLRIYPVVADADIQARLVEIANKFWRDHVETGTPPPVDGSESSTRWLSEQFPENRTPLRVATPEAAALMAKLFEARMAKAKAELEEDAAKNALKALLGDAEGMQGEGWRVTWKNTKGSAKTDWEAICRELNVPEELKQKFTRVSAGSRRFLPTWKES